MSFAFGLCLIVLFGLAAIGTPVGYSIIVGSVAYLAASGQDLGLAGEQIINGLFDSFVLLAVPLFIVAANIMNAGTISERLLAFCVAVVGRFKGGLGHVNIVASLIFSGMSGSAVADAAGIGKIIIDMMTKGGRYPGGYAAAVTAASATIGPVIPPSIPMVMYALVSDASIGYLFLGGILPGLLMGGVLMIMNAYISHRRGYGSDEIVPLREVPKRTITAFPALMMPVILLYGIYGGATTPTEAAAVAAAYAFVLAAVFYRALTFKNIREVMLTSLKSSASVGLVIGGALILNYVVATENIPKALAVVLQGMEISPLIFIFGVNLLLLALGCVLDATTIILVIVPLFMEACKVLGIDLVHFGVIVVVNCMIGLITPPYGILLFVINGTTGIKLSAMIKEVWPFLIVLLIALGCLIVFPEIVLWLPQKFGYAGN
jgi:tripartite ATP-independent transporter DctM subunit